MNQPYRVSLRGEFEYRYGEQVACRVLGHGRGFKVLICLAFLKPYWTRSTAKSITAERASAATGSLSLECDSASCNE